MRFTDLDPVLCVKLEDGLSFLALELTKPRRWRRGDSGCRTLHDAVLMAARAYDINAAWLVCLLVVALDRRADGSIPRHTPWERIETWERKKPTLRDLRRLLRRAATLLRPTPS